MSSAFVTGGSGFIGGALIERLRREGWDGARPRALGQPRRRGSPSSAPSRCAATSRTGWRSSEGATGCEVAFHCAAKVDDWGDPEEFERLNVYGTQTTLDACIAAGVRRFVHAGTEAALSAGQALVDVNEDAPLRPDSPILYAASKAAAEQRVRAANGDGIETVVMRPRFVWGRGDTTLLPELVKLVESGRFRWIGGGGHLTDTTNVDNTVEGLWLGATKAPRRRRLLRDRRQPGRLPGVRDELARAPQGVDACPTRRSRRASRGAAAASRAAWRLLKRPGPPPLTRMAVWVSLAGVHARHLARAARARLPARRHARRGPRRALLLIRLSRRCPPSSPRARPPGS